ncbi:HD-GYP domain-containing protein [Methylibium sp.]|uniref:HD-GYP domain-containing protein n=1 Tax=Methylibium sp. TaxID=2067992 RepID=UPI003D0BBFBF
MLKRIATDQLRPGMYLHELCGSWMDHPFWRSRFVLKSLADIEKIRSSGISEVWINVEVGMDVDGGANETEVREEIERELEAAATAPSPLIDLPRSRDEQLAQARKLIGRSREAVTSMFAEARLGRAMDVGQGRRLVEEIAGSVMSNPGTLLSLARLKTQDTYTYLHSVAVCALMVSLGRQLGLSDAQVREAGLAGLMHDLGKAVMPPPVLNKPGRLTDEEFAIMRTHPERGHALLLEGGSAPPEVLDVCLHHHEKVDGSGYPYQLAGDQISLLAKMAAVCDVYDAITSDRPYKMGWDPGESLRRMAQWKGHFDPLVFQAFVKTVGIYPVGSLVRLHSGSLAVVIQQNPASLLTPKVKVFFSTKSNQRIVPEEIDLGSPWCKDKVMGCEPPDKWSFKDIDRLWAGEAARP